jgi:hypothetical protein
MTPITEATEILTLPSDDGGDVFVIVRHLGEERVYATCPYQHYADDVAAGLRALAGLAQPNSCDCGRAVLGDFFSELRRGGAVHRRSPLKCETLFVTHDV